MIRCRFRSGFRAFARWVNAPEPPRLSVDNALKIAGEEAVHFHTSLSGVARLPGGCLVVHGDPTLFIADAVKESAAAVCIRRDKSPPPCF